MMNSSKSTHTLIDDLKRVEEIQNELNQVKNFNDLRRLKKELRDIKSRATATDNTLSQISNHRRTSAIQKAKRRSLVSSR